MRSLVLGNGQIGQSVTEVIKRGGEVIVFDNKNMNEPPILKNVDILHVCFPYQQKGEHDFVETVDFYIQKYQTRRVIIWSTVPIGTTKKIRGAVHSPVEGRHPKLASSIRSMTRWVGFNQQEDASFFTPYFENLGLNAHFVPSSDFTEFLKLRSTSKFGINLAWTEYEAKVAEDLGMDFRLIKEFDIDYNKLYHNIGMDWAQRYILDPPNGKIGGHCVVPNAELLNEQYPSVLLEMIKDMK